MNGQQLSRMLLINGSGKHLVCLGHSVDVFLLSTNCPQIHLKQSICTIRLFYYVLKPILSTRQQQQNEVKKKNSQ